MINGFLNIDKGEGVSSAFVVGKIKYNLKQKCGHMGTLDPLASGVLPIAVGKSTRLFNYLLEKEKEYLADFTFGKTTDTLDRGGQITDTTSYIPTALQLEKAANELVGEIMQYPPRFSAKNINGRRGYELARKGIDFELKPSKVFIKSIDFINMPDENTFTLNIKCGGGTYIRSICRDIAKLTGSLAYMSKLRRLKSGVFNIDKSIKLEDFLNCENKGDYFIKPDTLIDYPKIFLNESYAFKALNGVGFNYDSPDGLYRLYDASFIGIAEINGGILKIKSLIR